MPDFDFSSPKNPFSARNRLDKVWKTGFFLGMHFTWMKWVIRQGSSAPLPDHLSCDGKAFPEDDAAGYLGIF